MSYYTTLSDLKIIVYDIDLRLLSEGSSSSKTLP